MSTLDAYGDEITHLPCHLATALTLDNYPSGCKNALGVLTRVVCRFFFSSRRRHTRCSRDWSSDVCSSDLGAPMHYDVVFDVNTVGYEAWLFPAGMLIFAVIAVLVVRSVPPRPGVVVTPGVGRASCRGRGEISVGAGSLKKKKAETQ